MTKLFLTLFLFLFCGTASAITFTPPPLPPPDQVIHSSSPAGDSGATPSQWNICAFGVSTLMDSSLHVSGQYNDGACLKVGVSYHNSDHMGVSGIIKPKDCFAPTGGCARFFFGLVSAYSPIDKDRGDGTSYSESSHFLAGISFQIMDVEIEFIFPVNGKNNVNVGLTFH